MAEGRARKCSKGRLDKATKSEISRKENGLNAEKLKIWPTKDAKVDQVAELIADKESHFDESVSQPSSRKSTFWTKNKINNDLKADQNSNRNPG